MSDVRIVWCSLCVTCFMVSSIISPWSVPNSEVDWTEVGLLTSEVLWQIGGGRLLFVVIGLSVILFSWLGPGGAASWGSGLTHH